MRAILLIALALAACDSDGDVADMTSLGEFCGTHCCTTEQPGQACTTGDYCRYDARCPPGYLQCVAGVWVHSGPDSCDMAASKSD